MDRFVARGGRTGVAKHDAEKCLVTKLVNDIEGVTSVINNMSIPFEGASNK